MLKDKYIIYVNENNQPVTKAWRCDEIINDIDLKGQYEIIIASKEFLKQRLNLTENDFLD